MRTSAPDFIFPDDDLGHLLVDLYFMYMDHLHPLLHRPTFDRKVREKVYLQDHAFGSVYLLVCANGSRYSDDPRVFLEATSAPHSAGWKYFEQVPLIRKTLLIPPTLEDLQVHCVRTFVRFQNCPAYVSLAVFHLSSRNISTTSMLDHRRYRYPSSAGCRSAQT